MIQLKVNGILLKVFCSSMLTCTFQTMMNCIDNSGAAIVECVKVMRMKRHAKIGAPLLGSYHRIY